MAIEVYNSLARARSLALARSRARSHSRARGFPGELHRIRDSWNCEADTVARNRIILTPRNAMNEVFKFYREHLYPITPIPSFRHCLMWAFCRAKCTP